MCYFIMYFGLRLCVRNKQHYKMRSLLLLSFNFLVTFYFNFSLLTFYFKIVTYILTQTLCFSLILAAQPERDATQIDVPQLDNPDIDTPLDSVSQPTAPQINTSHLQNSRITHKARRRITYVTGNNVTSRSKRSVFNETD